MDDIFIVWLHSIDELNIFFDYMNKVDPIKKKSIYYGSCYRRIRISKLQA